MLEVSITKKIKASKEKLWETLTNPDSIRNFLFGTTVKTDWKEGGPITFEGSWEGKTYKDKGKILTVDREKTLRHTFWSSLSGKEDKPENYVTVTYDINDNGDSCDLVITQDGVKNEKELEHLKGNWEKVADGIKQLAEEI